MSLLKRYLPILEWLPNYKRKYLSGDISAGITVGIILIPQGMAYAMLAGLPAIYGLYAAIIPIFVYALFGTAPHLGVGTTATASILVATGIEELQLAEPQSEYFIQIAILLALLVGLIQLLMGLFRLGFLVNFMSNPVISGFTSAAAFIITLSQLKHLLGIEIENSSYFHLVIAAVIQQFSEIHWTTFIIGSSGIFIILYGQRVKIRIPGAIIVTVLSILVVWLGNLEAVGVKITGTIPEGLPSFSMPMWDTKVASQLWGTALAIALVGFLESIAIAKAIQERHKNHTIDANQELLALGISKLGGIFFQALPTTGSFSRTAVNEQLGGKTQFSSLISMSIVVLTLLFLTPLFYYMPNAILASIIIASVLKLIDYKTAYRLWKEDRTDFYMLISTFLGTILLGIQQGILVGVLLSIVVLVYRSAYPHIAFLGRMGTTNTYRNLNRFEQLEQRDDVLIMRVDAPLYFANSPYIKEVIAQQIKISSIKAFVLHAETIAFVDSTGMNFLTELAYDLKQKSILFYISGATGPVRDKFHKTGFIDRISKQAIVLSIQEAMDDFDKHIEKNKIEEKLIG